MRERALQEFESLFERAAIPVLDIRHVPLGRLAVVVTGTPADESVVAVASTLAERFGSTCTRYVPAGQDAPDEATVFHSTAELIGQLRLGRADLVLVSLPSESGTDEPVDLDDLVFGVAAPILVLRKRLLDPRSPFHSILHSLNGNFRQTRNFSYPFSLALPEARLLLLHTIDQDEISDVREALRYTGEIDAQAEEQLLDELRRHGERYLRGVVEAARDEPFVPHYRLEVGPVVATVKQELESGRYGLLVIGRHAEGLSEISAAEYQLMHIVRDVPVLAL